MRAAAHAVSSGIVKSTRTSSLRLERLGKRPRLPKVDAEMQRWCASLEEELDGWPHVTSKPMFGLQAFYRGKNIFAALPGTRGAETSRSMLIKLPDVTSPRLTQAGGPGKGWMTFSMESVEDVPEALHWLERAYNMAEARRSQ